MKALGSSLVLAVLLWMAAPPAAWSVGPGGGAGGHMGGFGGGAGHPGSPGGAGHRGSPGGDGGRLGPGGFPHPMDPFDREGRFDHGGLHDHPRGFGRHHGFARFAYPVCFAYAYCPYPAAPCFWEDGHWAGQPGYYEERAPAVYGAWVPPGCY